MKAKIPGIKTITVFGAILVLGGLSNPSLADRDQRCSRSNLAGDWGFSEQGTHNLLGPWSEIGSFSLNPWGNGSGVAIITAAQTGQINLTVPLDQIRITSFNNQTCIGTASFIAGGDASAPRTIAFTMTSRSSFDYLSTTGGLTVIGKAQKRNSD